MPAEAVRVVVKSSPLMKSQRESAPREAAKSRLQFRRPPGGEEQQRVREPVDRFRRFLATAGNACRDVCVITC
jgi:hypothetical protein